MGYNPILSAFVGIKALRLGVLPLLLDFAHPDTALALRGLQRPGARLEIRQLLTQLKWLAENALSYRMVPPSDLGQSYMGTLVLTSLLVWEYLRSPAKNLVHFLQAIWLIGNVM